MSRKNYKQYFISGMKHSERVFLKKLIDLSLEFANGKMRDNKVLIYKTNDFYKKKVSYTVPLENKPLNFILYFLKDVGRYSISQSDLNFIAFPDVGNSLPGMAGDIFSKFLNQNLITVDRGAPYATFIEIQLIEWLRELIGYDYRLVKDIKSLAEVGGLWNPGGHMSNHCAVLVALNSKYPQVKKEGLRSLKISPKLVMAGKISHYSYTSAMHNLGLGINNVILSESNLEFRTDPLSIEKILSEHKRSNDIFMVVAVVGNSRTSSIDNIEQIYKVCEKYNVWLHVDACHGGALLFSDSLKQKYLRGIELADSVSLDPHKGMFLTYPSSYIIFKRRDVLTFFSRYEEKVKSGQSWDLGYINPFYCSRSFESLKLWMLINIVGKKMLGRIVEDRNEIAQYLWRKLRDSGYFVMFHKLDFYRMVFVFYPQKARSLVKNYQLPSEKRIQIKHLIDEYTHIINEELYEEGTLCLDEFKLNDIGNATMLDVEDEAFNIMSITMGNTLYTEKILNKIIGTILNKSQKYESEFVNKIKRILKESVVVNESVPQEGGPAGWM